MPARRYAGITTDTNTAATTQIGVTSAATVRPIIQDILISAAGATPADNMAEFIAGRYTAAGTSTPFTPVALDPGDPAALSAVGTNHSAEPTYTANAFLLRFSHNMRALARWVAQPDGGMRMPATAANGIGLLAQAIGGAAFVDAYTIHFDE